MRGQTPAGLLAGLVLALAVVGPADPAAAHGGPGGRLVPASNYRSRVLEIHPSVSGVDVRVVDAGTRLELINRTGETVTVLGYDDEPYLRVDAHRVAHNLRSPATYVNRDRSGRTEPPATADPRAVPRWQRTGSGPSARWHDHRAHWMGGVDPPEVASDPGNRHVVDDEWVVPLLVGHRRVEVVGDLVWIPGPEPTPWYLVIAGLSGAVMVSGRGRGWPATAIGGVTVLGVAGLVDIVGTWGTTAEPVGTKLGTVVAPVVCLGLAVSGLLRVGGRLSITALCRLLLGSLGTAAILGLVNLDWLRRSQLPTTLSPGLARTTVVVATGVGLGLVVLAGWQLGSRYLRLRTPSTPVGLRGESG